MKIGDAKLKGLRVRGIYGSQLPEESFASSSSDMSHDSPSSPKVPDHHPVGKRKKGAFTTMKKLANLLVCTLLCTALLLTPALAMADSAQASVARIDAIQQYNDVCTQVNDLLTKCGLEIVRQANLRIEDIIEESVRAAERAQSEAEVDCIIASMLVRTRAVSGTAQIAAAVCGVKTVCEYVPVSIGGRTVYVDPLRVVLV